LTGREPFVLDGLEAWQLRQDLLRLSLSGQPETPAEYARAAGRLPHGVVGAEVLASKVERVRGFVEKLQTLPAAALYPLPFALTLGVYRLSGRLTGLSAHGRADYRFGRDRSRDLLSVWINHLVLNVVAPGQVQPASRWVSEASDCRFNPIPEARERLEFLLRWYWQGLARPLPFLPQGSHDWAEKTREGKDGLVAARRSWQGSDYAAGECEQAYLALTFADTDPTADPLFTDLAAGVWLPLLEAMEVQA
jgi:exodeoxyribonuclease V gamma subunit